MRFRWAKLTVVLVFGNSFFANSIFYKELIIVKSLSLGNNRDQPKNSPKKSKEKINNDNEITNCWFWWLQTPIFRLVFGRFLAWSPGPGDNLRRNHWIVWLPPNPSIALKTLILGSIHDDPVVRAARAGRTVKEIIDEDRASPARPKFDTANVNSEYGYRYQNMKLDRASPRTPGE